MHDDVDVIIAGAGPAGLAAAAALAESDLRVRLIDEQIEDALAELLVSFIHDPVHGLLMTIGAGGIATEVLADCVQCLIPASRDELARRVQRLRCAPLLNGFRNRPVVDPECLLDALESVQQAALQLGERLVELEINPLLCAATACTAVDAYVAVRDNDSV
jgi:acetyl-CoA synthetase